MTVSDSWVSVVGMAPLAVAQKIRTDNIDILVELAGHTAGNRLDVMALRPAPIQVTYIGYPNTTGLETINYRITDQHVDPPDTTQQFSEELVRLPDCFLCYSPPDETELPPVASAPSAALQYITFGSFNNVAKINGRVVRLWARILIAVPDSRLCLKSRAFAAKQVKESCLTAFSQLGVDRSRIDLLNVLPSTTDHLDRYAHMDISLDTFPYAGTTTTMESLLMGVPVVTLRASGSEATHAQNVGVSLLTQIGCTDLIADSEDQFMEISIGLARSPERIRSLRESLRQRVLASPLCDGSRYMVEVENQYRWMWRRYCEDQAGSAGTSSSVMEEREGQQDRVPEICAGVKEMEQGQEEDVNGIMDGEELLGNMEGELGFAESGSGMEEGVEECGHEAEDADRAAQSAARNDVDEEQGLAGDGPAGEVREESKQFTGCRDVNAGERFEGERQPCAESNGNDLDRRESERRHGSEYGRVGVAAADTEFRRGSAGKVVDRKMDGSEMSEETRDERVVACDGQKSREEVEEHMDGGHVRFMVGGDGSCVDFIGDHVHGQGLD